MSGQKTINPWDYKPWWCQPWSIILTGVLLISGSWLLTTTAWVTLLVSVPIVAWWTYFLIFWPKLVQSSLVLNYQQHCENNLTQKEK
ncbi:MAG: DUF6737 family protein [Oscillatoria sp. PMC 1051.18]|uniref:DUF6737 family protein n=1 Tax=Oscillatoria salina TaxID=331517 RepID=UPI001CC931C8|nr:DUF6737 family protein [Oscillatoria salina]MEC4892124.1 DUF6737 family protein [Oscillatoria sp. PMC 1050.18]MEC5031905.1 DUF6737 family protein [Oscillatoria sp. PMC 1051.18]